LDADFGKEEDSMGILSKKPSFMVFTAVPCQSQTWFRQVLDAAKNTRPLALFAPLTIAVGLIGSNLATAQDKYPSRPVKIIHSLPTGSSPDVRIRFIAERLTKMWGQQVVVENRPGAGGLIGVQAVLAAAPDGYTLLDAPISTFVILPAQKDKLPVDVNRDLVPIGLTGKGGLLLAVSPRLGVNSLAELIALANKDPHTIVIGTNPAGSLPHLAARLLVERSKAPFTVLPYSTGGTNEAIRDILGGRVHAVIESLTALKGALDSGDLKALAIMSSERHEKFPDLPAAAETVPGLTAVGWQALVAPKGTPETIIDQLRRDLFKALQDPHLQTRIEQTGIPFQPIPATDLIRLIEADQKLWWPIVKSAGPK
jgi:tripartite-type tricarboxylate transporter receptor subunit TctC